MNNPQESTSCKPDTALSRNIPLVGSPMYNRSGSIILRPCCCCCLFLNVAPLVYWPNSIRLECKQTLLLLLVPWGRVFSRHAYTLLPERPRKLPFTRNQFRSILKNRKKCPLYSSQVQCKAINPVFTWNFRLFSVRNLKRFLSSALNFLTPQNQENYCTSFLPYKLRGELFTLRSEFKVNSTVWRGIIFIWNGPVTKGKTLG